MRIISGQARGMKLNNIAGQRTRPTGDRVKEALFNILGAGIGESAFLDLYAGSGAIGLEALSRGAAKVIWVEENPLCVKVITANFEKTRLTNGQVLTNDVFRALTQISKQGHSFDYIFLDPPYDQGLVIKTLELLAELALLKKTGIIIAEASKKEDAPKVMSNLCLRREKSYGDTKLYFYQSKEAIE